MAATTGGAMKAFLEQQGLGIAVYRDQAPEDQKPPYVVVVEDLAFIPDRLEDGAVSTGAEMVQVDLYQQYKSADTDTPPNQVIESPTLPRGIYRALHGSRLLTSGTGSPATLVYAVLVRNLIRLLELDNNLVHHAFTVDVLQQI